MAKRGQGEGSITKLSNGTYQARLTIGYDANGKQKRKSFYGKTKKEVQEKMNTVKVELNKGVYAESSNITVAEWMPIWLKEYKKRTLKPTAYSSLVTAVNNCVIEKLGRIKLKDLKSHTIQVFINELRDRGLSLSYIRKSHNALNMALNQAIKNDLISKNVIAGVQLPKEEKKEIRVFTPDEQKAFIGVAKNMFGGDLFIFMLSTGLRIGEALALTWDDIDFENKIVTVNKGIIYCHNPDTGKKEFSISTPKTKSSYREIPLLPSIIEMLEKKKTQPKTKINVVFPGLDGGVFLPPSVRRHFKLILQKADIADAHPHTLRHTFATRGLEKGIELKVMQEFLGHSSIEMTADIYTHVLPAKKTNSIMKIADTIEI